MSLYDMLKPQEKAFHDALQSVVNKYGPYNQEGSGVWVGYVPASQNEDASKGIRCGTCSFYQGQGRCSLLSYLVEENAICRLAAIPDNLISMSYRKATEVTMEKAKSVSVGDMVSWSSSGGTARGKVIRVIRDGKYNVPNSDFTITGTPEDPAVAIRIYRDGKPTDTIVGHKMKTLSSASKLYKQYQNCGCPECEAEDIPCSECDTCTPPVMKSDTYTPTGGMKAAARRALKWKEDGKATGAGTPVGWGRATDIVAGRSMSISTVRRMYSFFSRHEVDKKGKDFYNTSNPSNGRIMWDAWGGDAGFSWSRKIVEREKSKKVWQGSPFSSK